jgi:phosphohistidine phosphatase
VRVYLVRHGEAKSEEEDPDRPLTDRGATEVRRVVGVAAGAGGVMVERIVHSGKTRARLAEHQITQSLSRPRQCWDCDDAGALLRSA